MGFRDGGEDVRLSELIRELSSRSFPSQQDSFPEHPHILERATALTVEVSGHRGELQLSEQRAQVEAADGRLLKRVGLDAPEHDKWLGGRCEVGDTPESNCVWGIAFPGVWQWSLTIGWAESGWVPAGGT